MKKKFLAILVLFVLLAQLLPGRLLPLDVAMAQGPDPGARISASAESNQREAFTTELAQQLSGVYQQKQALTPAQRKLDSGVLKVVGDARTRAAAMAKGQSATFSDLSTSLLKIDDAGNIEVKLTLSRTGADQLKQLEGLGMKITRTLLEYGIVEGAILYQQAEAVAGLDFVTNLATPGYPSYSAGAVTSEGDAVTRAAEARSAFSVDGSGVKVGVMSDGVSHLANSVATGDLPSAPPVDVRKAGTGDEGTAMLEIAHDLAPGSPLAFYGPTTSTDMVTGIRNLRDAGSKVIVDDITFFDEPKFEDGPIALETRAFYAGGGIYVTSAGNSAQTHYAHGYIRTAGPGGSYPYAHDYAGGDVGNTFSLLNGKSLTTILQWNDKWGQARDDFDLFLVNSSSGLVLASSTAGQSGSGNPWEGLSYTNSSGGSLTVYIAVFEYGLFNPPSSLILDYSVYNNIPGGPALQYVEPANSVMGHAAVSEVLSTAATNAATPTTIAPYSSRGPGKVYFPGYEERQTPDITGVDGVNTKVGQLGYFGNPFYGTSAAAPHVAAIAALVWQAKPVLTSSQVRSALLSGTVDFGTPGWDTTWGFGRTDAFQAVAGAIAAPPTIMTTGASFITSNSAVLNSAVMSLGSAASANISFQWGLTANYTGETPVQTTATMGSFTANLTGLAPNTAYHFRAKAAGAGIGYGTDMTFATLGTVQGQIIINFDAVDASFGDVNAAAYLAGFGITLSNVTPGQQVAIQRNADTLHGAQASSAPNHLLESIATTWVNPRSFTMNFSGAADNVSFTRVSFLPYSTGITIAGWSAHALSSLGTEISSVSEAPISTFSSVPARAFALNGPGIKSIRFDMNGNGSEAYGTAVIDDLIISGMTMQLPPTVITSGAASITTNSAVLSAGVTTLGSAATANISFRWGLTSNYTSETPVQTINHVGIFSTNLTGLTPGTTYHFQAKAVGDGVNFGSDMFFTTIGTGSSPPPFLLKWGSLGSGPGFFAYPAGVAASPDGNIYVADQYNHRLQKFTGSGGFMTRWGAPGSGDGMFYYPYGVAVDTLGNVYVADSGNNRIEKFTSSGTFISSWGSFGTANGQFDTPAGVAVDPSNNVYVIEYGNHRIQKFNSAGGFLTKWGTPGSGDGQFFYPMGIATDASGNVYAADTGNNRIQKFTASGNLTAEWGDDGSTDGLFASPIGVATDAAGNVYVTDNGNNRVQKFTGTGAFVNKWGTYGAGDGQFNGPTGLAIDPISGNIFVADQANCRIQVFGAAQQMQFPPSISTAGATGVTGNSATLNAGLTTLGSATSANISFQYGLTDNYTNETPPQTVNFVGLFSVLVNGLSGNTTYHFRAKAVGAGTGYGSDNVFTTSTSASAPPFLFKWGAPGSGEGQFQGPTGMAIDIYGNVFVADYGNNRIEKFTSNGAFLSKWGSPGAADGQLRDPIGVAVDAFGNVYVADQSNHRIQKFAGSGAFITRWGTQGSADGQFQSPLGVAVDPQGNVYVADTNNHRIQKFSNNGTFMTKWGSPGSGDGQFNGPGGLAVDAIGNVYVADTNNRRIQKFTSSGGFISRWGTPGSGDGQFQSPVCVAVDVQGNVYVTDNGNNFIQKFSNSGGFITRWGATGSGDGQFNHPSGVAVSAMGNVYVADNGNNRIQVFGTGAPPTGVLASITVTPANPTVAAGRVQQFTATGNYTDGSTANITALVTWSSSQGAVAIINPAGVATSFSVGATTISATAGSIIGNTTLVVSPALLLTVAVTPANPSIATGQTKQFSAIGTYTNGTANITATAAWSSSNTGAVTIDSAGLATGVAPGTSTITATSGAVSGSTILTVTSTSLLSIVVTPASPSLTLGFNLQFSATGFYANSTSANITSAVTWTSATTSVATINSAGLASSAAQGSTVITAASGGISGATTLTVTAPVLLSLAVTPANPSVVAGETKQFTATGTYTNGPSNITGNVTWTSSDARVATVNSAGLATSNNSGTTTIRAASGSANASTTLTVTATAGTTVEINNGSTIYLGPGQNIAASGSSGIPVTVKSLPNLGAPANGLAGFRFDFSWDKNVINIISPRVPAGIGWDAILPGTPNNTTGTLTATGFTTTYSTDNMTLLYLGVLAVGSSGNSTSINVTITNLGDINGTTIPATPVNAPVIIRSLQSIAVTPAAPSIVLGQTRQFTATGNYTDGTTVDLTGSANWTSSNTSVATIGLNTGLATSQARGSTNITATWGGVSGKTSLTVTVTSAISINPTNGYPGTSATVTGSGFGAGETGIRVTYDGTIVASGISANSQGAWSTTFAIPASTVGSHTVDASGALTSASDVADITFTVNPTTRVAINDGNTINLGAGGSIAATTTSGIPVTVKGLPNMGAPVNGLAAFTFNFRWNKDIVTMNSPIRISQDASNAGWSITPGTPNNTTGTVSVTGFNTSYSTDNITLIYLGVTAVGSAGSSSSVNVTISTLGDSNGAAIPALPINAPVVILSQLAETGINQGLSANASGVVVVKPIINRFKNPSDNSTANISGGIGSYSATVSGNPNNVIQFLTVYGVSPFDGPSFNATTGVFSVASVASPIQASNTPLAEVAPILTGNTTTSVVLNIAFQSIGAASQPGLNVPEEHSNSMTFKRGDAKEDNGIDIFDALFIAQYIVGQKTLSQLNALNAASVKHDGAGGDKLDIFDALFIAQWIVGQKNAYYQ